ncbi:MAG: respiratory nitrate reductase subunit gamma, partial [Alteromonadaceae bacterium]|nr:respiratory nitrate reductase subunit gamma [Alteromonadaceae bacterium]
VYAPFISASAKQVVAIVIGGIAGVMVLIGGGMLLYRRLYNPRVKASSSTMDTLILGILVLQAALGVVTVFFSLGHLDGARMLTLASWAQSIVFFSGGAADYMADVSWIYKLHVFLGLTIILLFPFTRLVHVWSVPFGYVTRRYQLVRKRG